MFLMIFSGIGKPPQSPPNVRYQEMFFKCEYPFEVGSSIFRYVYLILKIDLMLHIILKRNRILQRQDWHSFFKLVFF